ncbi:Flagellin-like protein [Acidobacteriia bacterium SbA2]|nr:Flagellin-like protein [Acidobacteriia bacterium SbA2]
MGIRINPNPWTDLLTGIALDQKQENQAIQELSTGKKVNQPSDDPEAVAGLIVNNAQTSRVNAYLSNISTTQGSLQEADSTLNTVVTALTQAISLGTEGANGTLNQTDRDSVAQEVNGIQQQILESANQSFEGNYLFAGTAVNTAPFVANSASSSGVSYVGNSGVNSVQIGDGQTVPANLPGNQLFTASGSDVFQALTDLSSALSSGSNIPAAESEVQNAFNYINAQRSFYGTTLDRLNSATSFLNQENTQLAQEQNNLVGADMATAATELSQADVALNAAMAAGGKISQTSLLNYLT